MIKISTGLSLIDNPILAAKEAVDAALPSLGDNKVDLAIVFSSPDLACDELLQTINENLPQETPLIGCSGAAIISNQGIFKRGITLLLLSLPKGLYFNTALAEDIQTTSASASGKQLGDKLLYGFCGIQRDLSIIFSDGLIDQSQEIIYGLQEKLGKSFPIMGGSASDNLRFAKTSVYFNQKTYSHAAAGMLWGGKLTFGLGIKHGWKPLGKPRVITKSSGNIINEIDNQPASKVYEEYLGKNSDELQKDLRRISIRYPIGIYLSEENEYILRNAVSLETNGSLRLQGDCPQGSTIRLMIGTKESCLNATHQAIAEAKKTLATSGIKIPVEEKNNFVLIFNSVSRYSLLRKDAVSELEAIKNGFGADTPIIGVYTYAEQGPLAAMRYQGQAHFHNQTIAILNIGG